MTLQMLLKYRAVCTLWLLALWPALLLAQDSGRPLDYCVLRNGEVEIADGGRKIADIQPYIFSGSYGGGFFENGSLFKAAVGGGGESFSGVALVRGVNVDLKCDVGRLSDGIHVHYQLIPRQNVMVSLVEIYAVFPYADWMKAPFEFNDNEGVIPDQPTPSAGGDGWLIRQADSAPLSIGPSAVLGGLAFQMTSPGMHLVVSDNRFYDKNLAMIYSHRESGQDWSWEKEQVKDFDFNLTFNRPMAVSPCLSPTPTPSGPRLPTATPTVTRTPFPPDCLDTLVDDFDDPSRNSAQGRFNRWGGRWVATGSHDSFINAAYTSPGYGDSSYCASVTGDNPQSENGGEAVYKSDFFGNGAPFDARKHGISGVRLRVKGDGNSYWVDLFSAAHPNDPYCFNIVPPRGFWTDFKLSFGEMALKSWWGSKNGDPAYTDGSDLTGIGIESVDGGSFAYSLGRVSFYRDTEPNCPAPHVPQEPTLPFTPTPTFTPTWTRWPTATPTWTFTFTPKPTHTPVHTATRTPLFVPTSAASPISKSFSKPVPRTGSLPGTRAVPTLPVRRIQAPPTPAWRARPTPTPPALGSRLKRVPSLPIVPGTPPVLPSLPRNLDQGQTIIFLAPPANIDVTFADGPGRYQVEITDHLGRPLQMIYDHRVVVEKDAWLEWDGKNDKGADVPPGLYYVAVYKDGKALARMAVVRAAPQN